MKGNLWREAEEASPVWFTKKRTDVMIGVVTRYHGVVFKEKAEIPECELEPTSPG